MEWIHYFISIVINPISLIFLFFFTPIFYVYKGVSFVFRSTFPEDVAGKVVLITGASSGIGENLAYEYAKKGARLVLAARREERLRQVEEKARKLGSPDVLVIPTDVSNIKHCENMIDEAVKHFGQLDHLVNNAGILKTGMFDESNVSDFTPIMDVNFWGSVFVSRYAVPHLKKSKGKLIVVASCAGSYPVPRMSFYNASKAAIINFYDTLRTEFGSDIKILIVTPGFIESDMTQEEVMSDIHFKDMPVLSVEKCTRSIVRSACRGDRYLTEPSWVRIGFLFRFICPEFLDFFYRMMLFPNNKPSKKE